MIFSNDNGFFTDITNQSPLEQIETTGTETRIFTAMWVDYDNDGDKDLSFGRPLAFYLLKNENNNFTDVSQDVGFVGYKPPGFISEWWYCIGDWADYDLDGDLDCVANQVNNDNLYLFRNDDGVFTNVATEAGLDSTTLAGKLDQSKHCWDITMADIDLDGDSDLYSVDQFFYNENGVFREVTEEIGFAELSTVSYREFFDFDNDGDLDFFKAPGDATAGESYELWENRDGYFYDISQDVGLVDQNQIRVRCMSIGDMDNDGDLDIVLCANIDGVMDLVFVNEEIEPGVRIFEDVAEFVGVTKMGDRKGSAFFDYNKDGFLDIYKPSAEYDHTLYHNLGTDGNWIGFMLEGTLSNRDAVGSLVTLHTGDKKQIRHTVCSNGFLRQDNPWVHFGIGYATSVDSIVIRWPLGYTQVLTGFEINQYHEVKEPDYTRIDERRDTNKIHSFQLKQNYPNPFNANTRINFGLAESSFFSLIIYDINGKEIKKILEEKRQSGEHSINWDGKDNRGKVVPSGIYFYKMKIKNEIKSNKMLFVQ
jgi:hypothetical protein